MHISRKFRFLQTRALIASYEQLSGPPRAAAVHVSRQQITQHRRWRKNANGSSVWRVGKKCSNTGRNIIKDNNPDS